MSTYNITDWYDLQNVAVNFWNWAHNDLQHPITSQLQSIQNTLSASGIADTSSKLDSIESTVSSIDVAGDIQNFYDTKAAEGSSDLNNTPINFTSNKIKMANTLWNWVGKALLSGGDLSQTNYSSGSVSLGINLDNIENDYSDLIDAMRIVAYSIVLLFFSVNLIESTIKYELVSIRGGVMLFGRLLISKIVIDLSATICQRMIGIIEWASALAIDSMSSAAQAQANPAKLPTLTTFYNLLLEQPEDIARELALILELYVTGSFTSFADRTNVNVSKKFIVIDIFDMGDQLRAVGLQVILEFVWQRVIQNKKRGVRTWLWNDEFSVMFNDDASSGEMQSGKFFVKVYSRIRKHGGVATGITQNIKEILASPQAVSMLSNSEFIVLLQQMAENLKELVPMFELSPSQEAYLKTGEKGTGLIICGRKIIPFDKTIPHEGRIYNMISTDFKELQEQTGSA